jgi:L-seryl-tRNA(Ser) seleniumtransferase
MADLRALPSIDTLLQRPAVRILDMRYGRDATVTALRAGLAALRRDLSSNGAAGADRETLAAQVEAAAARQLAAAATGTLRQVINATGVVIHTNLGRAPLAEPALARIADVARGYATLEYDLAAGARGSRSVHAERLLTAITGAEAAVVVNNNAAALMLLLAALARGREVIISRGELVEIGGGFRVPDVMAQSGAVLREVGTTNRTRISDYTAASTSATALWLRVHPSNFRIEGFTERPALDAVVAAARTAGVAVAEDLGSGNLDAASPWEPTVQASLAAGVDVVCVSGDKMLGGPQAGIVLGRSTLVDRLRSHPLMRALRVDKLTYAALEATLVEHWAGRAHQTVPVLRMLHAPVEAVRARGTALAARLNASGWQADVIDGLSAIGGGSAPGVTVPTALVRLSRDGWSADRLEAWLREQATPIIARIHDGAVVLDLRTVAEGDDIVLEFLSSPSPQSPAPSP